MSELFDDDDFEKVELEEEETEAEREYEEEFGEDDEEEDSGKAKFFHLAFLIIFLTIVGIGTYTLVKWQKGERLVITEADLTENYDVESEDFYIKFVPSEIDGYVDDGEYNICVLTDGTIGDIEGENSIPSIIARETGANVDALYLKNTISLHDIGYTLDNPEDAFTLYFTAIAFSASDDGDYSLMFNALEEIAKKGDNSVYYQYWDKIHKMDFDKYDVIILCYGYEDYLEGRPFTGAEVYSQQQFGTADSTNGAFDTAIKTITNRFPYAQVLVSSPSFFLTKDKHGNLVGTDTYNTGNGTLGEYVINLKSVAQMRSVTFIDNYFGIDYTCSDYEGYLDEEGMPNDAAKAMIAEHIIKNIYFMRK